MHGLRFDGALLLGCIEKQYGFRELYIGKDWNRLMSLDARVGNGNHRVMVRTMVMLIPSAERGFDVGGKKRVHADYDVGPALVMHVMQVHIGVCLDMQENQDEKRSLQRPH
jgi:hypothetical protein